MIGVGGPGHILVLLAVVLLTAALIAALIATWRSRVLSVGERVILTLALVLFPAVGLAAWALYWIFVMRRRPLPKT